MRSVRASLISHANARIETFYPAAKYPAEGGIIPELVEMIATDAAGAVPSRSSETAFEMKQSTMSDGLLQPEEVFDTLRPNSVQPKASTTAVL